MQTTLTRGGNLESTSDGFLLNKKNLELQKLNFEVTEENNKLKIILEKTLESNFARESEISKFLEKVKMNPRKC